MTNKVFVAATLSLLLPAIAPSPAQPADADSAALKSLVVSFKMDPRLGGSTYSGERWLSPATFSTSAQEGTVGTVDARVQGLDVDGRTVGVVPEWVAADPEMVTVTPGERSDFRITVKRAGESMLKVAARGISKEMLVKAKSTRNTIQVEIIQQPSAEPPRPGASAEPHASAMATVTSAGDAGAKGSYALGMEMATRLKKQIPNLDADLVVAGVRDALAGGESRLTEEERKAALTAVQYEVRARQVEAQKQQAEKNRKVGEALLAENKVKEGVVTRATGLQYKVLKAGEGPRPTVNDTVVCHYRGTFADGTEFDSSLRRGRPATFALKRVIPGWREALQLMPVGSKWQIVVPSDLAYGRKGARGAIGPDATLIFDVELLAIKDRRSS